LARLLLRGFSGGARAVLEEPQIVAPPKQLQLLCFLLKNGSSRKTFGRAPLEEPEPEPERSPAKQALKQVLQGIVLVLERSLVPNNLWLALEWR